MFDIARLSLSIDLKYLRKLDQGKKSFESKQVNGGMLAG